MEQEYFASNAYSFLEVGEYVSEGETLASIETDKVEIPVNAPESGTLLAVFAKAGETVEKDKNLFKLDVGVQPKKEIKKDQKPTKEEPTAGAKAASEAISKEPAPKAVKDVAATTVAVPKSAPPQTRDESRVQMTRLRQRIAERLKESQNTTAALTTFNEADMSSIMQLRNRYKELVLQKHNVKLGFMSAFVKACTVALQEFPATNARIERDQIVYPNFVDISVAVATPKVPFSPNRYRVWLLRCCAIASSYHGWTWSGKLQNLAQR